MTMPQDHIREAPPRLWTYWPEEVGCGDCLSEEKSDSGRCYEGDHREGDYGAFVLRRIQEWSKRPRLCATGGI